MFRRKVKIILVAFVLFFSAANVFALEEYVTDVYKKIDECFAKKSESDLNDVLTKYSNDKYYYLMENYTQKKIRRLIVANEYDFAMEAILVVIENNLDNEEAVEMYSVISDAYEIQRKHEAELEHQRELEQLRLQQAKEKQRGNVEKEYVAAKKTDGGSVYVTGKETKLTSYNWKLAFGLADVLLLTETKNNLNTLHYGASIDFRYEYTLEKKMTIGLDAFGGFQFLGMAKQEDLVPMILDVEGAVKIASQQVFKNVFIRTGFDAIMAGDSKTAVNTTGVVKKFFSPFIGVKWEHIALGPVKLDIGADWLAGHLFAEDINLAAGASLNVEIPFATMEKVKLNLNIGARDKIFLKKDNSMENRASVILAIGVENVIR